MLRSAEDPPFAPIETQAFVPVAVIVITREWAVLLISLEVDSIEIERDLIEIRQKRPNGISVYLRHHLLVAVGNRLPPSDFYLLAAETMTEYAADAANWNLHKLAARKTLKFVGLFDACGFRYDVDQAITSVR